MSATTGEKSAIERYLDAVRAELSDLPDDERVDVLEDVEQHLLEVAAEDDAPLETRLGPPVEYAAELRAAAGLPRRGSDDDPFAQRLAARLSRSRTAQTLKSVHDRLDRSPVAREVATYVRSLRPAWWLVRAYLATVVLGRLTNRDGWWVSLFPRVADSRVIGVLAFVGLTVCSVAWSRRAPSRRLLYAALLVIDASLVITGAGWISSRLDGRRSQAYNPGPVAYASRVPGPFAFGDQPVTNIYPYAADGTPLSGILLYDQNGQPLGPLPAQENVTGPDGAVATTSAPASVPNLYPLPEPIFDPITGRKIGERQRPVIVAPPLLAATPSSAASPSDVPTAEQSPTASTPATSASAVAEPTASPSPSPSPTPSATSPGTSAPVSSARPSTAPTPGVKSSAPAKP
ncbi:MAG: hypothetical protein ABI912_05465 [Actinomycetota bacterium]